MYFSGRNEGVFYILASINIHVGIYMDSDHYYHDLLDYNTGSWLRCNGEKISNCRGYPDNVYDELSHKINKSREKYIL